MLVELYFFIKHLTLKNFNDKHYNSKKGKIMFRFFNISTPNAIECLSGGKCSIDPKTFALNEAFIYETRQLTYYLLKIKELGYENLSIVNTIINTLSSINFGFTYQPKEVEKLLNNLYTNRTEVIDFYKNLCKKKNLDCQLLQSMQPDNSDMNLIKAIMSGEKQSISKNTQIPTYKKNLYEIIIIMVKSASSTLTKLSDYGIDCINERYKTLELINSLNFVNFREEKLARKIIQFAQTCYEINNLLNETYKEKYKEPTVQTITFDQTPGHAILVSGENFNDFDLLLQSTEGTGINVYTHDKMILALQYPYFKRYSHLKGHYQNKENNFRIDFSEFPGAILLTRDYMNKIDSLYRGSLFSTDSIAGLGITKLQNYNFAPLIKAANEMSGFQTHKKGNTIKIGYNLQSIMSNLADYIDKINNNNFQDIYIVGLLNYGYHSDDFFERLYKKIGENNLIISLAYDKKADNIFHIKSFFDFSLVYKILQELKRNIDTEKHTVKAILTQCTNDSLTNLFILKKLGIENIYITCCNVNTLNPSIINCLKNQFSVKQILETPEIEIEL